MTQFGTMHLIDRANLLTFCGAVAGLGCALAGVAGRISFGVLLLIVAGLCDLFDGYLARRVRRDELQRAFGARLDSLADVCSFGFAPAVLLFSMGLRSPVETAILGVLLVSVIWRLTVHDTRPVGQNQEGPTGFIGLPCTYVALVLPFIFTLSAVAPRIMTASVMRMALVCAVAALAMAMISRWHIPKPGVPGRLLLVATAILLTTGLLLGAPLVPLP